jgi:hypothetical protein
LSPSDPPSYGNPPPHPSSVWDGVAFDSLIPTANSFGTMELSYPIPATD